MFGFSNLARVEASKIQSYDSPGKPTAVKDTSIAFKPVFVKPCFATIINNVASPIQHRTVSELVY